MSNVLLTVKKQRMGLVKSIIYRSFHKSSFSLGAIKPFLLADIGEGITECEVVQWFVKQGDTINEFDKVCEVQSDKASVEISSRYSGKVNKLYYSVNDIAKVGQPLIDVEAEGEESQKEEKTTDLPKSISQSISSNYKSKWEMPSVRRLLKEYGLEVNEVLGSGKNGIVLKSDILKLVNSRSLKKVENPKTENAVAKQIESLDNLRTNIVMGHSVPLNPLQKEMFKSMTNSLSIPQLGFEDEIDLSATSKYRDSLNKYIKQNPNAFAFQKMSFLPIFIKSMSLALSYYPILNSQLVATNGQMQIKYRDSHNIGIAIDTPKGLVVPNVKSVEKKSVFEIASEIHRLIDLSRKGSIAPADLMNGTITISNIGSIGGTYSSPIINTNELAIVALGSAKKLPRLDSKSNELIAKYILPVSWSADHRIIDGATIAQFGNTWKRFIENPMLLASELR